MDTAQDSTLKQARRTARAEASAWIVRLHGPHRSAELEAGFRDWLAASPENARQFERVTEVWDAGAIPVPGMPRLAHNDERASRKHWLLAAAIGILAIGAGGWGANYFWLNPTYSTRIGEQRIVRLSDGSRVTLIASSEVQVSYRRSERRISVERGEAFFEVESDPARPFRVTVGQHQVEALGTSFVVRREAELLSVTLIEGKVAVSQDPGAAAQADGLMLEPGQRVSLSAAGRVTLEPGQRLSLSAAARAPQIDQPRIDAVTAWRRGEVVLDSTALADAVAEMNRYDERRLVIDDPFIAGTKISGIYHTGNSEHFAEMVSRLYGFEISQQGGEIHLGAPPTTGTAEAESR